MTYVEHVFNEGFKTFVGDRITIRFADINAPELSTKEGVESKNFLTRTLERHGYEVCLDIDNMRTFDPYNRVIAVIYIKYNETHWLNLNKYMVDSGHAYVWDFHDNEFDPSTWSLYVIFTIPEDLTHMSENSKFSPLFRLISYWLLMVLVLIAVFGAIFYYIHKRSKINTM